MPKIGKNFTAAERQHHLVNQPKSGLTIVEYCRQNSLSISTFDNWKLKAKKRASIESLSEFIELPVLVQSAFEVRCGSFSLLIPPVFAPDQLTQILSAMNRAIS